MIAKEVEKREGTSSFTRLIEYLTDDMDDPQRVQRVQTSNLCNDAEHDPGLRAALLEVALTQERNHRVEDKTYHMVLSFHEQLSEQTLDEIEARACAALGFEAHQRVSVLHGDTEHPHLHITVNRIHPETHLGHSPSFSKRKLNRLCVELEREYGLQVDPHALTLDAEQVQSVEQLQDQLKTQWAEQTRTATDWTTAHEVAREHGVQLQVNGAGGLTLVQENGLFTKGSAIGREFSRGQLEKRLGPFTPDPTVDAPYQRRQLPRAAPKPHEMERVAGKESLIGWLQREVAPELEQAQDWISFHAVAASHGVEVKTKHNGLVFHSGEVATKGSAVARDFSRGKLEKRLGPFEPAPEQSSNAPANTERGYQRDFLPKSEDCLIASYQASQQERGDDAQRMRQSQEAQLEAKQATVERAHAQRRAFVEVLVHHPSEQALWTMYIERAHAEDQQRLEQERKRMQRELHAAHGPQSWIEWLQAAAKSGDRAAAQALTELGRPFSQAHQISQAQQQHELRTEAGLIIPRQPDSLIAQPHSAALSPTQANALRQLEARLAEQPELRNLYRQAQHLEPPHASKRANKQSLHKPDPGLTQQAQATTHDHRLQQLPESALAPPAQEQSRGSSLLLPRDARNRLHEQRAEQPDRTLRRPAAEHAVDRGVDRSPKGPERGGHSR